MHTSVDRAVLAVLNVRLDRVGGVVQSPTPDGAEWLVQVELPGAAVEAIRGSTPSEALASASAWVEGALRDQGAE